MPTSLPAAVASAAVVAVALTAVATGGGVASAATSSFTDQAGDVGHGVDLRTVKVVNGEKAVWVTTTHRDLVPDPASGAGGKLFLDTDPEDAGPEYALVGGYFEGTDYMLTEVEGWNTNTGAFTPADCSYRMRIDYDADTVRTRFGHDCFGDADLRVELRVSGTKPGGGSAVDWLGTRTTFTPWVKQG